MFWKVSSFSSGSAIEGILDKQQITLEELLEEDELVQVKQTCFRPEQVPASLYRQAEQVCQLLPAATQHEHRYSACKTKAAL